MTGQKKNIYLLLTKVRQEEIRASNEMYSDELKVIQQKDQLDTCLNYREESLNGLKSAKSSGLSIVQIRECQLLVQYLDTVVETWQYKTDICEERYEKSKSLWQSKNTSYLDMKKTVKNLADEGADEETYEKVHKKLHKELEQSQQDKEHSYKYVANYRR